MNTHKLSPEAQELADQFSEMEPVFRVEVYDGSPDGGQVAVMWSRGKTVDNAGRSMIVMAHDFCTAFRKAICLEEDERQEESRRGNSPQRRLTGRSPGSD